MLEMIIKYKTTEKLWLIRLLMLYCLDFSVCETNIFMSQYLSEKQTTIKHLCK